jgi:anti-sigma regulatory factor (Ser/Thr protein kinase)
MPSTFNPAARWSADGRLYASVTVPTGVESIRLAVDFLVQAARAMRVPAAADTLFEAAIVEAVNNAVEHGDTARRPDAVIVCEIERVNHRLTLRVLGQGPEFALSPKLLPEWDANDVTTLQEGGFGLPIIQSVFPTVHTIARTGEFGLEMALTF